MEGILGARVEGRGGGKGEGGSPRYPRADAIVVRVADLLGSPNWLLQGEAKVVGPAVEASGVGGAS